METLQKAAFILSDEERVGIHETFARNLSWLMAIRKISPTELSEQTGISTASITHYLGWHHKYSDIGLSSLCALGKYFDVSIGSLVDKNFATTTDRLPQRKGHGTRKPKTKSGNTERIDNNGI